MNKIYIVLAGNSSECSFSSEELAKAYIENKLIKIYEKAFSSLIRYSEFVEDLSLNSAYLELRYFTKIIELGMSFDILDLTHSKAISLKRTDLITFYYRNDLIEKDRNNNYDLLKTILGDSFYMNYRIINCKFVHELS